MGRNGISSFGYLCSFGAVFLLLITQVFGFSNDPSLLLRKRRAFYQLLTDIELTDAHKNDFVNKHNELRRAVAPGASNMKLMTWDNELASLAVEYTKNCEFAHSSGLRTSLFPRVGENLRIVGASSVAVDSIPNSTTQMWYDEVKYYDYDSRSCQTNKQCGHYKQVVYAESYRIGCGISVCSHLIGWMNGFLISCNYGVEGGNTRVQEDDGLITYKRPYQAGAPCSQCGADDTCVDRLCANPARDGFVVKQRP